MSQLWGLVEFLFGRIGNQDFFLSDWSSIIWKGYCCFVIFEAMSISDGISIQVDFTVFYCICYFILTVFFHFFLYFISTLLLLYFYFIFVKLSLSSYAWYSYRSNANA